MTVLAVMYERHCLFTHGFFLRNVSCEVSLDVNSHLHLLTRHDLFVKPVRAELVEAFRQAQGERVSGLSHTSRRINKLVKRPNKNYIQFMHYSTQIRPISYVKANAAQVLRELTESRDVLVITQNGEATAVMQDIASYEANQQALALLKILALGNQQIELGKVIPAADAIARIRAKRAAAGE